MKNLVKVTLTLLLLVAGCISVEGGIDLSVDGTTFPIKIVDNYGANVTVHAPPKRIVSLAPSNTEILFAIGLGERVVGVTDYDDHPPEASKKERIGGFTTVNMETVVSLQPDLVLATGGVQIDLVQRLRDLDLTVVVVDAKNVNEILENIKLIGRLTGSENEAESLAISLEKRIDAVKKTGPSKSRPRTMYIVWGDPLMAAGPDAFASDLIEMAGGENVFTDAIIQYPTVSMESVIERDPEIIITGEHSGINLSELKDKPEWRSISAVKNNRLHSVEADIISRAGPRIVDALELFSLWVREG
jgi:iron complex transport system substrate-binding protein